MYKVELILPKDMTKLENRLAEVMAEIVAKRLTPTQMDKFIEELEKMEGDTIRLR